MHSFVFDYYLRRNKTVNRLVWNKRIITKVVNIVYEVFSSKFISTNYTERFYRFHLKKKKKIYIINKSFNTTQF